MGGAQQWIGSTLTAHAEKARTVASCGFPRLPHFFNSTTLASAKVVVVERLPIPPLSLMGLPQFAEFERANFSGVTYLVTGVNKWAMLREPPSARGFVVRYALAMMTLGNMRENGVRSLAIACGALWCHHEAVLDVSGYADDVTVPAFGPRMVCTVCGAIGADARPNWNERVPVSLFGPKLP